MANLLYESIHYAMWVGIGLCLMVFLPFPRIIRVPFINGLEYLLTNKAVKSLQIFFLSFVSLVWVNSMYQMKQHQNTVYALKELKKLDHAGTSAHELEKTINQSKMFLFLDQRNAYMTFFVLILFYVLFSYIYSLKRDDRLHKQLTDLERQQQSKSKVSKSPEKVKETETETSKPKKE